MSTRDHPPRRPARAAALGLLLCAGLAAPRPAGSAPHPLDPLDAIEYRTVLRALAASGHADADTRFPLITLEEPDKVRARAWTGGEPAARRAFVVVKQGRRTFEAVVDLAAGETVSWTPIPGVQPGMLLTEEWTRAQEIVRADPGWREALRERGIDDPAAVVPVPLTVGNFGDPRESAERLVKVVSFDARGIGNFWGRPIEGLIALVSFDEGRVIELVDRGVVPVPDGPVDFDPAAVGAPRRGPNPITLNQPRGPSYELDGHLVRWQKWSFHWRIDPRLGPVLSLVEYADGDARRSILYQGSLSEMFVPYTDPDAGWYFRAYMDAGEYGIGKLAAPLTPGLDCPAHASFFDPLFADEWGNPYVQERAACLFERYAGEVAWRHHEAVTGETAARRLTELVLRVVPAIGNYDYVYDWVFRPDGSIGISIGATGVPQVKGVGGRDGTGKAIGSGLRYGHLVGPRTLAVHHDHFFSFRLDLDVDGPDNSLLVDRLRPVTLEPGGPRRSSWVVEGEIAATEGQAKLRIDLERPALWRVINSRVRGPLGHPASYQIRPGANAVSLLGADEPLQRRAGFTDFHLWATPYDARERYAAGAYPNQSRGGDGLPRWTARDRPIRDTDLVLWYTLGMHHVVRSEDWPVMPTSWSGFELRPFDFFTRNPALDLPPGDEPDLPADSR